MLLPGLARTAARQRSLFGVEASGAELPLARDWAFMEHPPARMHIDLLGTRQDRPWQWSWTRPGLLPHPASAADTAGEPDGGDPNR
ncbi:hypothetical protein SLI_8038 [Streptomyces lividans 1326]|uniref:Uncharacterized protein n=1 Tax=Streptomyces lividans 1326 TaxID=1200984 RepID=A0A7U9HHA8_STRLI|nr:hypothetical protein SLI_8038 [Streptomyces lividans 1326]